MNTFLRRKGLGLESCNGIAKILREEYGKEITAIRNDKLNGQQFNTVIRWGCTSNIRNSRIINFARHIHAFSNKVNFRRILQENDISIPKTYFSKDEVINDFEYLTENGVTLLGRPFNHAQGKDIAIIESVEDLLKDNKSNYWNEFIQKDKEYRIYVFFGKVIKVDEKVPTERGKTEIAWNHAQGNSHFTNVRWSNWPINACLETLKVFNVIPLHFGAIDIIQKDDNVYILEGNTAGSITGEYGQNLYAKCFNWMLDLIEETGETPPLFNYFNESSEGTVTWKNLIHPTVRS